MVRALRALGRFEASARGHSSAEVSAGRRPRRPDRSLGGALRPGRAGRTRRARGLRLGRLHAAARARSAHVRPARGRRAARPSSPELLYDEACRITRDQARSFAWGIRVLPAQKRRAVSALYAFARRVDDIADDPELAPEERRASRTVPGRC